MSSFPVKFLIPGFKNIFNSSLFSINSKYYSEQRGQRSSFVAHWLSVAGDLVQISVEEMYNFWFFEL